MVDSTMNIYLQRMKGRWVWRGGSIDNMIRQYFGTIWRKRPLRALNPLHQVLHEVSPTLHGSLWTVLWIESGWCVVTIPISYLGNCLNIPLRMDSTQPVVFRKKEHYLVVDGFHPDMLERESWWKHQKELTIVTCNRKRTEHACYPQLLQLSCWNTDNVNVPTHPGTFPLGWTDDVLAQVGGMDQDEVLRLGNRLAGWQAVSGKSQPTMDGSLILKYDRFKERAMKGDIYHLLYRWVNQNHWFQYLGRVNNLK